MNPRYDIDWYQAFEAWQQSGKSMAKFWREDLSGFCRSPHFPTYSRFVKHRFSVLEFGFVVFARILYSDRRGDRLLFQQHLQRVDVKREYIREQRLVFGAGIHKQHRCPPES